MSQKFSNEKLDGRKERVNSSRKKIVEAMLELIREGVLAPSAEQVAYRAKVGLRTVFRRFNELELLYRELSVEIQRIFRPKLEAPIEGKHWQERLIHVLERKLDIYNLTFPYRVAARFHMHSSEFIRNDIARWNSLETQILESILPINKKDDYLLFNAVNVCMSFDYWLILKTDHALTDKDAADTIKVCILQLLKEY
jgi:AcrR family transcriptional regulator